MRRSAGDGASSASDDPYGAGSGPPAGHVSRNVAALAKAPRVQVEPVRPYSVDEVQRILEAAKQRPNGARWAIALALGLRKGRPRACAGTMWTSDKVAADPRHAATPGL